MGTESSEKRMKGKMKPARGLKGSTTGKVRVTQGQIARELGFSQSLVSNVLNGRRQRISEESFRLIWDYARNCGYRLKGMLPEFIPKAEKKASVGYLLRSGVKFYSQNPFFAHVQHGLHDFLAGHGIALIFLGTENHLEVEKLEEIYRSYHSFRGLVVMGEVAPPFLHSLKKLAPRIVSVAAQYPGMCDAVCSNDEHAADLMVHHLLELGHRSFAWLGGNRGMQRSRRRLNALNSALRLHNLAIAPEFSVEMKGDERMQGRQCAEAILKASTRGKLPTSWICFNAVMARGAVSYLLQQGISVPGDISLITFDNTRICEEDYPTLTGVGTVPEEIGRVAGELLLQGNGEANERFSDTLLPSKLIVRESTGIRSPRKHPVEVKPVHSKNP
jgi:LacI family transcriptional regulator